MRTKFATVALVFSALGVVAPSAAPAPRSTVIVQASSFGRVLFDGRAFVLYGFTRDERGKSACSGACARAWPPYIVKSPPHAAVGVAARLLGTTRRTNGARQVTYAGRPLYYYVGDRKPGQILCQNVMEFGGVWRVIRPTGRLVG
jgi:predicted lipoprotein with Yx(FWY)xxD motif